MKIKLFIQNCDPKYVVYKAFERNEINDVSYWVSDLLNLRRPRCACSAGFKDPMQTDIHAKSKRKQKKQIRLKN